MQTYLEYNHGRWVVNCPNCPNAYSEDKLPDDLICGNCGTALDIIPPNPLFRRTVEEICASRPEVNRNWIPGETTDALLAENIIHGVDNP